MGSFRTQTGTPVHICNDREKFLTFTPCDSTLMTTYSVSKVEGKGSVRFISVNPVTNNQRWITLTDVAYIPGFPFNTVSYGVLSANGNRWDEPGNCIRDSNGTPVMNVRPEDSERLWVCDVPKE